MQTMAKKGVLETLQATGSTTGNGTVLAISPSVTRHLFVIKTPTGTYTTGKVQCESADDPTYSGTWVAIGSELTLASAQEVKINYDGVLPFVRCRISTNITGASAAVGVTYLGSNN